MAEVDATGPLVERLFRREYAQIVAQLARRLGAGRLELAEDAAQEALLRALRTWPFEGLPDNPAAWLAAVARRAAVDQLRGAERESDLEAAAEPWATDDSSAANEAERDADVLRLMLLCCHPRLPVESRVALVLKDVCGFGLKEVAAGLLARPDAVKRRLGRAHATLREHELHAEGEAPAARAVRIDSLLLALYLLFNEGYAASGDEKHVRAELVDEALRLARLLAADAQLASPEVEALTALFCLQAARSPARLDDAGVPLSLAEQDRSLWDRRLLAEGFARLERSLAANRETRFHLEAAIAACHASAAAWRDTDWARCLEFYDRLAALHDSPIVRLNRCVPLAQVRGASAALAELECVDPEAHLPQTLATRAQLLWLAGRPREATPAFEAALAAESSTGRRRFLDRRLAACRAGRPPQDW